MDELKNGYLKMPIEELARLEESYIDEEFTPEAQKVIKKILEVRKHELDNYRKRAAINKTPNEEIGGEEREISDFSRKVISRKVTCKKCGFEGVVEAHDTRNYPATSIFKLLGKDDEGYIHLKCPSCKIDNSYSPYEFLGSKSNSGVGCVVLIVLAILAVIVMWMIFK